MRAWTRPVSFSAEFRQGVADDFQDRGDERTDDRHDAA